MYALSYIGTTIDTSKSPHSGLITVGSLLAFGIVVGIFFFIVHKQKQAMESLATKNGWQELSLDDTTLSSFVPTYLNNSESIGHKYRMAYKAQDIVFFRYENQVKVHTINNDSASNDTASSAITAFEVPQNFQELLILHHSKIDNTNFHPNLDKINLEGNFSSIFDVYAPRGTEVEALSLLTPDIMAFLVDNLKRYQNLEINGHTVIIERDADEISPSKITSLVNYATSLRNMLRAKPIISATSIYNTQATVSPPQVVLTEQPSLPPNPGNNYPDTPNNS
jgi:hypothetical protein